MQVTPRTSINDRARRAPIRDDNANEAATVSLELNGRVAPGDAVEVRNRFDRHWARGFEVLAVSDQGYRLRRMSDGLELPAEFAHDDVRARREPKRGTWWY
jgi:hypothetical protein